MEYSIEPTGANEIKITITGSSGYTVYVEPNKIVPLTHVEEEADVTISPSVEETDNVHELYGESGDEFTITFAEDGVYKLYVTENSVAYVYVFISTADLDEWLYDSINTLLCLNNNSSTNVCNCSASCATYYGFNVVAMLCMTFVGDPNNNVAFNFNQMNSGYLYAGYQYECVSDGEGSFDWRSSGTVLLQDSNGNNVTTNQLTVGKIYTCIESGTPDEWGTVIATVLTPLNSTLVTSLNYIADSIDRFERYLVEPSNCN